MTHNRINGSIRERTPPQVHGSYGEIYTGELPNALQRNYATYREMRRDPTIAFVRMLSVAPLVTAGWGYEVKPGAPKLAGELIERMLEQHRMKLLKAALEGYVDYGWQPWEVVFGTDEDAHIVVEKFKPLLQERTWINVMPETGEFIGLEQRTPYGDLYLSKAQCLVVALDVEGTDWYGTALMENARDPYNKWAVVEAAAARYDKKIAGSHWVIHYPMGRSTYDGVEGVDNFEVAKKLLASLQSSGAVVVPTKLKPYTDDVDTEDAWRIELLSDGGQARASFGDRQRYIDSLKVRAFGFPERAVLEGQFGTKAEAESHADFAITIQEMRHALIVDELNQRVVSRVLRMNYGPKYEQCVRVTPTPLSDPKITYLRGLYGQFLANPEIMSAELDEIDLEAIREQLSIPKKDETSNTIADMFELLQSEQGLETTSVLDLVTQLQSEQSEQRVTTPQPKSIASFVDELGSVAAAFDSKTTKTDA